MTITDIAREEAEKYAIKKGHVKWYCYYCQ